MREQAVSTHRLIERAVAEGRDEDAAELARYTLVEMAEPFALFPGFFDAAQRFLLREGVPDAELAHGRARAGPAQPRRVVAHAYESAVEDFAAACTAAGAGAGAGGTAGALEAYQAAVANWRQAHDDGCDRVYRYADLCARHLGEDRVEDFWDELMGGFYDTRDRFDLDRVQWRDSLEILALDTAETFRGHLSGPGRLGDIEIVEESDRIVFRFSPCGTGGRTFVNGMDDRPGAGDDGAEDAGPGAGEGGNAPRFGVTTRPHDWSWGKAGVCLYCVHCCQLQERIPIRRFGYPLRVVDPPLWPQGRGEGRCTWTIYKDPSQIPAAAYERVGETKPAVLGSSARSGRDRP